MRKKLILNRFITCGASAINWNTAFCLLLFLLAVSATNFTAAQSTGNTTTRVRGVVTEKGSGQPLSGVTVKVKGGKTGTSTDNNGAFTVDVPSNSSLVITYVGFNDQEVSVKNQPTINIELERGN